MKVHLNYPMFLAIVIVSVIFGMSYEDYSNKIVLPAGIVDWWLPFMMIILLGGMFFLGWISKEYQDK